MWIKYIQAGNNICLELGNKRDLIEQSLKVKKYILSAQKNLRRKLQLFCTRGSVVLRSERLKYKTITLQF
jgi:hypothetical protein